MVHEFDALAGLSEELLSQITDPRSTEMVTRWDMIESPPDILVTNYSMLNVMLMRRLEQPMFAQTRAWLQEDSARVFTLVVDELHLYRGTQGAEVALIVRNLLDRLGLEPNSPQVRVIGTSASLGEVLGYLESFFGLPRATFSVIPGNPRDVAANIPLDAPAVEKELEAKGFVRGIDEAIAQACLDPSSGRIRATTVRDLEQRLFGSQPPGLVERVLESLAVSPQPEQIPFRAHLFMHHAWAVGMRQPEWRGPRGPIERAVGSSTAPDAVLSMWRARPRASLLQPVRRCQSWWLRCRPRGGTAFLGLDP